MKNLLLCVYCVFNSVLPKLTTFYNNTKSNNGMTI